MVLLLILMLLPPILLSSSLLGRLLWLVLTPVMGRLRLLLLRLPLVLLGRLLKQTHDLRGG